MKQLLMIFFVLSIVSNNLWADNFYESGKGNELMIDYSAQIKQQKIEKKVSGILLDHKGYVVASSIIFTKDVVKNLKKINCHLIGSSDKVGLKFVKRDDDLGLVLFEQKVGKKQTKIEGGLTKSASKKLQGIGEEGVVFFESIKDYENVRLFMNYQIAGSSVKPIEGRLLSSAALQVGFGGLAYNNKGDAVGYVGGKQATKTVRGFRGRSMKRKYIPYIMILPLSNVWDFVVENGKKADNGWLGLYSLQLLDKKIKSLMKIEAESAILISQIVADSPADMAGVKAEDVLIEVKGEAITLKKKNELGGWLKKLLKSSVGKDIPVKYMRKENGGWVNHETVLKPIKKPKTAFDEKKTKIKLLGIEVCKITWDVKLNQKINDEKGVYVTKSTVGTPGYLGGVRQNVIIRKVHGKVITSVDDLQKVIESIKKDKPKEIQVLAQYAKKSDILKVALNWDKKK